VLQFALPLAVVAVLAVGLRIARTLPPPPWQLIVVAGIVGMVALMILWMYFDEYMAWMHPR
jgi:hypothetical protein